MKLSFIHLLIALSCISIYFSSCQEPTSPPAIPTVPPFCYTFNNSTSAYDTIQGGTVINTLNSDDFYEIDLGFNFCNEDFPILYLTWAYGPTFTYEVQNGINNATGYELIPAGVMDLEERWEFDTAAWANVNRTRLLAKTTGNSGNKVCTIEWRNFEYTETGSSEEFVVNFQIKLYENGNKIEFHYGPNDVTTDFSSNNFDFFSCGIYGENDQSGVFLYGNPSSPSFITAASYTHQLDSWPLDGTVFTFE